LAADAAFCAFGSTELDATADMPDPAAEGGPHMAPDHLPSETGMLTLAGPHELEIDKIKGSRFLGFAWRVDSVAALTQQIATVAEKHSTARHLCWGWRGSDEDQHRSSDAGEPRGSAGPPILRAIEGFELLEVGVLVLRYFGGTKLGVGGLIRAYGGCARELLEAAEFERQPRLTALVLRFTPAQIGAVNGCLQANGIRPGAPSYSELVELRLAVPTAKLARLREQLMDACAGQIEFAD
jgi:uncharacterized YigZ family protein